MLKRPTLVLALFASLYLIGSIASAQLDNNAERRDAVQAALASLEDCFAKVSRDDSKPKDPGWREAVESFRLMLDFHPTDRHRFLIPRQPEVSKTLGERFKKLFENKEDWNEFLGCFDTLVASLERELSEAETIGSWKVAYELRWKLASLGSILPSSVGRKAFKSIPWSHAEPLMSPVDTRKAFANHPKTRWPAGSYNTITTPHFEIAYQSEPRSAAEVATLCEQSFAIWKQMFFEFWADERIVGPEYPEKLDRKFSVVLFRDRQAYTKTLRSIPNIGVSTGYYDPNQKIAFFYWDGTKTPSTVIHELTHQFFYEAGAKPVALDSNRGKGFWVVEAVALYLESMSTRPCGGGLIADVGGWDSPRLQAGRYRRLHDKYWVTWDEFHTANGTRFRSEEDIGAWYSQATGLAHLWLDGTVEKQLDFTRYIESVYANNESPEILGEWNDDRKLRDAYDQYLIHGPSKSPNRPFFNNRREAVLSRCRLSSEQLLDWPIELRTTPWLDLSFSQINDKMFVAGGEKVTPNWNVQRLNLESTEISDLSMPSIAENKNLSELDLSNCNVSDLGVESLRDHKSLKVLWLNHCDVTDKSIDVLLSISQLEAVHLAKTRVTPKGWSQLQSAKPRLKLKSTAP